MLGECGLDRRIWLLAVQGSETTVVDVIEYCVLITDVKKGGAE
jgi:hypothetical protein